jgi:hypothetical protein
MFGPRSKSMSLTADPCRSLVCHRMFLYREHTIDMRFKPYTRGCLPTYLRRSNSHWRNCTGTQGNTQTEEPIAPPKSRRKNNPLVPPPAEIPRSEYPPQPESGPPVPTLTPPTGSNSFPCPEEWPIWLYSFSCTEVLFFDEPTTAQNAQNATPMPAS